MSKTTEAELTVLQHLMHTLEEGSVSQLTMQDVQFASYIDKLYESICDQSNRLRDTV